MKRNTKYNWICNDQVTIEQSDDKAESSNRTYNTDVKNKIQGVSKINIFVGENNVGKSRLMRLVMSSTTHRISKPKITSFLDDIHDFLDDQEPIDNWFSHDGIKSMSSAIEREFDLKSDWISRFIRQYCIHALVLENISLGSRTSGRNLSRESIYNSRVRDFDWQVDDPLNTYRSVFYQPLVVSDRRNNHTASSMWTKSNPSKRIAFGPVSEILNKCMSETHQVVNGPEIKSKLYIPILRGLRLIDRSDTDPYSEKTAEEYAMRQSDIFSGQLFYDEVKSYLLGSREQRSLIAEYQDWLGKRFFDGKEINITPATTGKVTVYIEGEDKDRNIEDLGDGLQSMIILTFKAYMSKRNDGVINQFYIEEPEISLHPGMQRTLVDVFRELPGVQLFLTTHSNHLLDMASQHDDTSVYTLKSAGINRVEVKLVNDDMLEAVHLLGARPSSMILVNATIWVEGPTDMDLISMVLDLYQCSDEFIGEKKKAIYRDMDYGFVFLAGTLIDRLDFIGNDKDSISPSKIGADAMFICDSDGFKCLDNDIWLEYATKMDPSNGRIRIRGTLVDMYEKVFWKRIGDEWFSSTQSLHQAEDISNVDVPSDSEFQPSSLPYKLKRHIEMKENESVCFHMLEVREIECLHSWEGIWNFVRSYQAIRDDAPMPIPPDGWKNLYIGDVLSEVVKEGDRTVLNMKSKGSVLHTPPEWFGALRAKKKSQLIEEALPAAWDDLSDELKRLARVVYEFVSKRSA